jgi:tape measure domain-containing protein
MSQDMAERTLREFGNANATAGGGKAELSQVLRAVSQMSTKPFLQGDELLQLTEAGIPAYKMLKDIFGTSDTEELKKAGIDSAQVIAALVAELEKAPRVAGGAKNTFENVGDALSYAAVVGGQAISDSFLPYFQEAADAIEELSNDGTIKSAFEAMAQDVLSVIGAGADDASDLLMDVMQNLIVASAMWRNVSLNLKEVGEFLAPLIERAIEIAMPWTLVNKKPGAKGDGTPSPFEEGERWREDTEKHREWQQQKKAREEAKKKAQSASTPTSGLIDPITGKPVNPGARGQSAATPEAPTVGEKDQNTVRLLSAIEKNTRPMESVARMVLGGGELGRMGVMATEMATRKRRLSRAQRMLYDAFEAYGVEMIDSATINDYRMARAGR